MLLKESLRAYVTPKTLVKSVVIALAAYLAWKAGQTLAAWPSDELPHPVQEEGSRTAEENDEVVGELTLLWIFSSVFIVADLQVPRRGRGWVGSLLGISN